MAVHPLRPATDRRLGEPLPHQPANQTRGHLSAHKALTSRRCLPKVSCGISSRFQLLSPTERQVPHALLTRSPLSQVPKSLNQVSEQFASSKITQEFSLAVFSLTLKQSIIVQGVIFVFALFNLQDTACSPHSRLACSVYHALCTLSRTFFVLFHFPLHAIYFRCRLSRNSLHILPRRFPFVKP